MNKFQQACQEVRRFEEKKMLRANFRSLIAHRRKVLLELCSTEKTWNIKLSTTSRMDFFFYTKDLKLLYKRYEQIHIRGLLRLYLSSLHIPHGLWTLISLYLYTGEVFSSKSSSWIQWNEIELIYKCRNSICIVSTYYFSLSIYWCSEQAEIDKNS